MIRAVVLSGLILVGFVVSGQTGDDFGARGRVPPPPPPFHGILRFAPPPPPAHQAEETHFLPQVPRVNVSKLL